MATPSIIPKDQATILLNIFDGSRQPIGPGVKNLLVRIIDGNQKQLFSDFRDGSSFQFQVPFYDNFGDSYTVVRGCDHGIAVTEIVIERDLKLKTGTVAKVTKQLFLIPVNDAHKEILDSRSDRLTRSVEDVQQNCGMPV